MNDFDVTCQVAHLEANRMLKDAVMRALKQRGARQRISVTDLTSLKQAYYRRKHPDITPSLERQEVMWSGTGFHELFGAAVSSEEYLEQFVELDGITGKIDIFEDMPVEIKTTRRLADETNLPRQRPSYIEQLGMYCGMVNVNQGRIVIYQRDPPEGGQPPLSVCHVRFSDLEGIRSEMRRRRDLLADALARDDPSNLPRCPWGSWGCDYSEVCDCKTSRVPESHAIVQRMSTIEADPATAGALLDKIGKPRPARWLRLNDLVFPRKAFFALKAQEAAPGEDDALAQEASEQLSSMSRYGVANAVRAAFNSAAGDACKRVPVKLGTLVDSVTLLDGRPAITRDTALRSVVSRERLPQVSPHYFLRLGFECALTEQRHGRLALYYRNVPAEDSKLMVYDVSFRDLEALKAEAARRARLLEDCQDPQALPSCPDWMCRWCKFEAGCRAGQGPLL